jgi:C1A family cysteine protease
MFIPNGLGWQPDLPDFRDFTPWSPQVTDLFRYAKKKGSQGLHRVDLRRYFRDVYDQRNLGASAAHACVDLLEYFERRSFGINIEPSVLFLHQLTTGSVFRGKLLDSGLRSHLRTIVSCGLPPSRYWPYEPRNFRKPPPAAVHCFAKKHRTLCYLRLDMRNSTGANTLELVRAFVAAGFPVAFGFPVPDSLTVNSDIPYRPTFDNIRGGQALVAVGFDDRRPGPPRGALLIRSSWGNDWGEQGYGWLPYAYVEQQLASCFWTMIRKKWLKSGEFYRPHLPS